ncbi:MAG TPA: TetR/AcrR family transcriptional regulator [Smithellaceae bacterium]|nr:TetR/AcrR family transcriptional regulator [Smithellaceae bacterium]
MTRKTQRKEREYQMRRAAILEEAEKIFSARGYHQVTVAEIAAAAGFSTGFLYRFFEGKQHLYRSLISEKLGVLYETIRAAVGEASDPIGRIDALVASQLRFVEENRDFCRIFVRGETDAMSPVREVIYEDYFRQLALIERLIKDGVKKGVLRRLPPEEMAGALIHILRSVSVHWLLVSSKTSLSAKKDVILDIFLHGVKQAAGADAEPRRVCRRRPE